MKKRVKIITAFIAIALTQNSIVSHTAPFLLYTKLHANKNSSTLRPLSFKTTKSHRTFSPIPSSQQMFLPNVGKTSALLPAETPQQFIQELQEALDSPFAKAHEKLVIKQTKRRLKAKLSKVRRISAKLTKLEQLIEEQDENRKELLLRLSKKPSSSEELLIRKSLDIMDLVTKHERAKLWKKYKKCRAKYKKLAANLTHEGLTSEMLNRKLPLKVTSVHIERKGIIENGNDAEKLNAGVLSLGGERNLSIRNIIREKEYKPNLFRSEIGLYVHKEGTQKATAIDPRMLMPDDRNLTPEGEGPENVIAFEDARILARDGFVHIFMTVVVLDMHARSGYRTYVVETHHEERAFLAEKKRILKEISKGASQGQVKANWSWSRLKRVIDNGPCARQNHKNFVPMGNPVNGYWLAFVRPEGEDRKNFDVRALISQKGLNGPWLDIGITREAKPLIHRDPRIGWLGFSAFVAEMPEKNSGLNLEFTLFHLAEKKDERNTKKYYDLWMLITDRKKGLKQCIAVPFLLPELDQAFEADGQGWVQGAIYSCGAILTKYNEEKGEYTFDIYYSGSDSNILLATVTVTLEPTEEDTIHSGPLAATEKDTFLRIGEGLLKQIEDCKNIASAIKERQNSHTPPANIDSSSSIQELIAQSA